MCSLYILKKKKKYIYEVFLNFYWTKLAIYLLLYFVNGRGWVRKWLYPTSVMVIQDHSHPFVVYLKANIVPHFQNVKDPLPVTLRSCSFNVREYFYTWAFYLVEFDQDTEWAAVNSSMAEAGNHKWLSTGSLCLSPEEEKTADSEEEEMVTSTR